ncbi:MAG: DUF4388 domain-containing protein [Myxococcota bacterium]
MQSRLRPLNILDAEWRRKVWKRWLLSHLAGFEPVEPHPPAAQPAVSPPPAVNTSVAASAEASPAASSNGMSPNATVIPPPLVRESETRRGEVRARFDALFDRMLSLEDTLDALGKRFALRAVHERRHDQRVQERLDSVAESLERQTLALESLAATLERIEQRVERLERRQRAEGLGNDVVESRESRLAPSNAGRDEFDDLEQALGGQTLSPSRAPGPDSDTWDEAPFSASSIRGNLAEMSLPTVLAMLELERRTGVLKVHADDGSVVSATLRDGAIVGARQRDLEAEPVDAVREALRFPSGHFWFRQAGVEVASGPPRSVGQVLLEATRRNDEAVRSA